MPATPQFDSVEEVVRDIRAGKMVIVTDDADRENEGDLVMAAEKATAAAVNFMATHGRGLICAPITQARAESLGLERMARENREAHKTDFTVAVDAARGISTGISAADRARTIGVLANPKARPGDLVQPGHIFPLRAKDGGVLRSAVSDFPLTDRGRDRSGRALVVSVRPKSRDRQLPDARAAFAVIPAYLNFAAGLDTAPEHRDGDRAKPR